MLRTLRGNIAAQSLAVAVRSLTAEVPVILGPQRLRQEGIFLRRRSRRFVCYTATLSCKPRNLGSNLVCVGYRVVLGLSFECHELPCERRANWAGCPVSYVSIVCCRSIAAVRVVAIRQMQVALILACWCRMDIGPWMIARRCDVVLSLGERVIGGI